MQKLELLAPAKDYNCALSAINSGADAIYIGASDFGARNNAKNNLKDIEKIISYAHIFNVKVYVTLNTILDDCELIRCKELIEKLYEIKADAVIIQDFGILQLSYENKLPPIVLHMSTQCDIRDVEKVKFFNKIGIKRVILARELNLDKIKEVKKQTDIELEHFIFGALCVSYSGQCYLSHYIGKRSANKGMCAQACRKKYSLINKHGDYILKNQYLLSLKDNNLSNHLNKLIKAGITSFKIEGRLKDELYVKNVVLYFHNLLKNHQRTGVGRIISDFEADLYKTFNRGFCDDYLFNKKDNIYNFITPKSKGEFLGIVSSSNDKCFCVDTNKAISSQDGLCFELDNELEGCFVNNFEKTKTGFKIFPNKKLKLKKGVSIFRNTDTKFNKLLENSKTTRKLDIDFIIYNDKIEVMDDRNNKAEIKFNNFEDAKNKDKMKENFIKSLSKTTDTPYYARSIKFLCNKIPFIPISKINEIRKEILELLSKKILSNYRTKKQKPVNLAQFPKEKGDYKLNVHNKKAKEFYENCNCEILENSFETIENHKNKELMRTKHCLKRASIGCKSNEELFLLDEKGVKYKLKFDCKNCEMVIMSI